MMNTVKKLTQKLTEVLSLTFLMTITKTFEDKVNDCIKKYEDLRVLDKKWANYLKSNYCKPGMYELIKTYT